jgi:hypothetical protein
VVLDDVACDAARVPERFKELHWTKGGPGSPDDLAGRVQATVRALRERDPRWDA